MAKKITADGTVHEHGKGFEFPSGKYLVIFIVAAVIMFAAISYFVTYTPSAPMETKNGPPTDVKTNPATDANTVTAGTVAIPADALIIPGANSASPKIPIGEFPKSIFIRGSHTLYTNIEISSTAITGWVINSDYVKRPDGTVERFSLQFWKGNDVIKEVYVQAGTGDAIAAGYSGKGFRAERPPETLGADSVSFLS